jgi:hypothetical protein
MLLHMRKLRTLASRFTHLLPDNRTDDGCWEWEGYRMPSGYGTLHAVVDGKRTCLLAHRASWLVNRGQIKPGQVVMHKCDNPGCVNPGHLELGTQKETVADMLAKGRRKPRRAASAYR